MKQELDPFEKISREIGISLGDVEYATSRFLHWLSNNIRNYDEGNRDFLGEELHWKVSRATFYHLLGLFDEFSDRYSWERGSASRYLLRIAPREEWPSHDDPAPARPDPKGVADTIRQFMLLADGSTSRSAS